LFHQAQVTETVQVETQPGVSCWQKKLPIEKVGLYIPGGSAPLFSTVLMLAVPAKIAGCNEVILCSPPSAKGTLSDVILYTANLCCVDYIFKVGGMQAIAGMTLGTESIPKVDKIFGPGNQFVTIAKQLATKYQVAIDMPAGPSELMVVADQTGNPDFIASDLLSQAEHGPDSQVILITNNIIIADATLEKVSKQLKNLERKVTAQKALNNSKVIFFDNDKNMLEFVNLYGAEHLIVCLDNESEFVDKIKHAGSVFIGNYTPESAGDYASGTNHTLPTNGYVRQYSGVNLDSFLKAITYQKITANGLVDLGPVIELMASAEGLEAHKNAVSIRLKTLKS
jgi:histidinol dehydrogenase